MISAPAAAQQQYPSQAITIVVAAAAGGFADGVARTIGDKLGERLGQSVIIENKGGAGGNLGARTVAQSQPDGHTVLVSTTSMAINGTLYKNMGYATADIRPAAIVGSAPETIVVHPSNPAKNLAELVQAAKSKSVEYGSAGVGSGSFIAAEYLFKVLAKVQTVHVPFPGGAPAVTAVLGNHIGAIAATVSPLIPHINSGALRGLGIASAKRQAVVPIGSHLCRERLPRFLCGIVGRVLRPVEDRATPSSTSSTPPSTISSRRPRSRNGSKRFGLEPIYGNPAETTRFFNSEAEHWGKMVRTLGLSIN